MEVVNRRVLVKHVQHSGAHCTVNIVFGASMTELFIYWATNQQITIMSVVFKLLFQVKTCTVECYNLYIYRLTSEVTIGRCSTTGI